MTWSPARHPLESAYPQPLFTLAMELFDMTSEPVEHLLQRASWSLTITTLDTRNECRESEVDYCSDLLSQKLRNRRNDLESLTVPNAGAHPYL